MTDALGLTSPAPITKPVEIPPEATNKPYPSETDAAEAMQHGLGYGTGNEAHIEGDAGRSYHTDARKALKADAQVSAVVNRPSHPASVEERNKLGPAFAQAEIAKGRSAIATLGYDPHKVVAESDVNLNIGGAYDSVTDRTLLNIKGKDTQSALIHESLHRGFEKLRQQSPEAKDLLSRGITEESLVRYIMATKMGDPENKENWPTAREQRGEALRFVKAFPDIKTRLDRLEEIAAELHKERRPRGPR